jgi:hypothetical protein
MQFEEVLLLIASFNVQKALAEYFKTNENLYRDEYEHMIAVELSKMNIPDDVRKALGIE